MKNKNVILIGLFCCLGIGIFIFVLIKNSEGSQLVANEPQIQEKIKVAACPTCFELTKNINKDKYEIFKTNSTAENLALLQNKKVDMILAGRTLKPNEPKLANILIEDGYSFLSNQGKTVSLEQLNDYNIYTDLDAIILKNLFPIKEIKEVDDVYQYLDKGIIITSWENTDYTKAQIVHLLEKNGERVKLSRRPTVYCPNICDEKAQELVLKLK